MSDTLVLPPTEPTTSPEKTSPRLHLDYLDGARACAAIYVIMYHSIQHTWSFTTGASAPAWFLMAHFFLQSGRFAVSLFIIISGFCLMLPVVRNKGVLKGGAINFFKRRAKRILPPYYAVLLLSALILFTLLAKQERVTWEHSLPAAKQWFTFHGLLIQNWQSFFNPRYSEIATLNLTDMFTMPPDKKANLMGAMGIGFNPNGPLWSIAVEWQIYFFFPLLVLMWRRIGAAWTVTTAMLLTYSFYIKFHYMAHGWMAPHYLGLFTLGMLGANIAYGEEEKWVHWREKRFWHPLAYTLWAIVLLININPLMGLQYSYMVDLIAGPASLCLLVASSKTGTNRLKALLSRPKLVFLGTFSYSIYLVHDPLLRVVLTYVLFPFEKMKILQWYLLIGPGIAMIVGVAYLFHRAFERPFMNTPPQLRPKRVEQGENSA